MKLFKVTLIAISLIWTIYNFWVAINSPGAINLVNFIEIVPIITALYTEVDLIYIHWNKLRAFFFLKTVSFTAKSYKYVEDKKSITELENHVRELLSTLEYKIVEAFVKRTHEDLYFTIESGSGVRNDLVISTKQDSNRLCLTIKCEYQIAYRDVDQFWKSFLKIRNDFFSKFATDGNVKERYDVTINSDKNKNYSPFYRLTVRHVGKVKVEQFNLNFSDDNLKVQTSLNKIYATSDNYQDIEKLIKEYIPLSKLS